MPVVLEGIVTTVSGRGDLNVAPMGPHIGESMDRFVLRLFRTSATYRNLLECAEGVFHVTDDVLLLAQAAIGNVFPPPKIMPACTVRGFVLEDSCRYYEFRVTEVEVSQERAALTAEVVDMGRRRDFIGFNRAKHAVLEAAILATRLDFLPLVQVETEYRKLRTIVDKTGGAQERHAFELLEAHLRSAHAERESQPSVQR